MDVKVILMRPYENLFRGEVTTVTKEKAEYMVKVGWAVLAEEKKEKPKPTRNVKTVTKAPVDKQIKTPEKKK